MKMPTSQTRKTTHLARGPAAVAKLERGGESIRRLWRAGGTGEATSVLQDRQVPVALPLRDRQALGRPLLARDVDVAVGDVPAERPRDELGHRRQLDRLAER